MSVHTGTARALMGDTVPLKDAVRQWANLGALVAALFTGDRALLSRSLVDVVAEPKRAGLVPGFYDIKAAALDAGALGCSLSGSGPSLFALASSMAVAQRGRRRDAAGVRQAQRRRQRSLRLPGRACRRPRGDRIVICISTRGVAPAVSFREALFSGLAPDGGLYVPQVLPVLDPAVWTAARGATMADIGTAMLGPLVGDEIPEGDLKGLLTDALDFPVPIVRLDERLSVVELFHGPTFAFKDVGARVLARLMSYFHERRPAAADGAGGHVRATPAERWPRRSTACRGRAWSCCIRTVR